MRHQSKSSQICSWKFGLLILERSKTVLLQQTTRFIFKIIILITLQEMISIETTPLVNKRLSAVINQSPKSPFHVSTPDSPYGQIFKSNPSPDTRKGWVKWVDNFPDLQVAEPPLKRRAPSTVSIILSRFLIVHSN